MTRRRARHALGAAVVAVVLATSLAGCQARPRVIVYGDSLVWESSREITQWAASRGWDVTIRQRFGGAPCSFFSQMRADRASRPDEVILSFAGNPSYLEPCVGADVTASYRAQMREVKRIWTGSGTEVTWAEVPFVPAAESEPAQQAMRVESHRQGLKVIDAGRYVTPDGVYVWTQPCMAGERCIGSQLSPSVPPGRNIVRANDRTHFCPGPGHGLDPCPVYSSGSWRYARALTEALVS
ncbi:hypothetical protein PO878_07240 [Iamia majanohamensis]|uniref:SGNH/GDSL hydrolase family protein n=1 Tax=Iamia majanohamensis TaxID=467976 RepID=A0AAE9Y9X6_9ACTN|nr:hypothetical protein [Iamia majanohamensis]WCO68521.1 hypothetical protein PO878_07240 [Iamia majanohamensis]